MPRVLFACSHRQDYYRSRLRGRQRRYANIPETRRRSLPGSVEVGLDLEQPARHNTCRDHRLGAYAIGTWRKTAPATTPRAGVT